MLLFGGVILSYQKVWNKEPKPSPWDFNSLMGKNAKHAPEVL